jgi:predicted RNA binding protein YcfA (HicA-like mRNA interferase family)
MVTILLPQVIVLVGNELKTKHMKVYNDREIKRILKDNGYYLKRIKGDHEIWASYSSTRHITIPHKNINRMVWQRLVKENNLLCKF